MNPCKPYIYEFLYRGRPDATAPDDPLPAWHLQLEARMDNGMGGVSVVHKTMNMAQAEANGWPLPAIISEINVESLRTIERERHRVHELEAQTHALTERVMLLETLLKKETK